MAISATQVKELREQTGAGIMECKRALEEPTAISSRRSQLLKQQGLAKAEKKSGREASQGVIEPYIHGGGRIGAMVEVNCETDFVARTPDFRTLAHDIAMQVAAIEPAIRLEDRSRTTPGTALEQRVRRPREGDRRRRLLDQPSSRMPKLTIRDLVNDSIAKLGENIVVRRFARFEVGADLPARGCRRIGRVISRRSLTGRLAA